MRYPTSDDIISILTRVISFLTNQLAVFSRPVKAALVVFPSFVWFFWSFCFGLFASRSWSQVGLSRSQMRNWIRRRTRKSDHKEENCVWLRVIQEFHSDIKPKLAWFNISSWAFTTSSEQPLFELKFIFGFGKKGGFDYEPTILRGLPSSIQRYLNKQN